MKKFRLATLALIMALAVLFAACDNTSSKSSKKSSKDKKNTKETEEIEETEETNEPEETEETSTTEETTETSSTEPDYEAIYAPLVEQYIDILDDFDPDDNFLDCPDGYYWTYVDANMIGPDRISKHYGYIIRDINGDDIPELLIVNSLSDEPQGQGSNINAIFTYDNGETVFVAEGWYRNAYSFLNDGSIGYYGNGGYAYTEYGKFTFDEDFNFCYTERYYTNETTDNDEFILHYYSEIDGNTTEITDDDFFSITEKFNGYSAPQAYTSFKEYADAHGINATFNPLPVVVYVFEATPEDFDYFSIYSVPEADDSSSFIYFSLNQDVTDLNIVKIENLDVDSNGNITCNTISECNIGNFDYGKSAILNFSIYGDIPSYGVSFTTSDGASHLYAISISGESGLFIAEELR